MKTKSSTLPSDNFRTDCFEAARKLLDNPSSILTNIMASMGDGLSIQDLNMRIVYQNKFMIDNFGSHVGDYCYNIYEKRSTVCEGCPIVEAYRTGEVTKALRVGITKDGLPFRFENIASVLRDHHNEIVAGIELCRIVEERERAYDALRDAMNKLKLTQDQLARAEKLSGIGQLSSGVSNEISNPTAYILSNLSVISRYVAGFFGYIDSMEKLVANVKQEDVLPQEIMENVQQIINSSDYHSLKGDLPEIIEESLNGLSRIKTVVSDLLLFATSNDGLRRFIDINAEIESALLLLENEISQREGRVVKNFNRLPMTFANPQQLQQMFINLILNACQTIEPGGTISIRTGFKDNNINIEIADTGEGIPESIIQNIFNPFYTAQEVGKGVGLGLSIAYRIIESHNGNIDVKSEQGEGTTFTIRLPVVLGQTPEPDAGTDPDTDTQHQD